MSDYDNDPPIFSASEGKRERYYLEIRDQSGKEIDMPTEEKEVLDISDEVSRIKSLIIQSIS